MKKKTRLLFTRKHFYFVKETARKQYCSVQCYCSVVYTYIGAYSPLCIPSITYKKEYVTTEEYCVTKETASLRGG